MLAALAAVLLLLIPPLPARPLAAPARPGRAPASQPAAVEPACPRPARLAGQSGTPTVLFIGNSFTFSYGTPVRFYRPDTVVDLNRKGTGGVPALFKTFAEQAGCEYAVSLETAPGVSLDFHLKRRRDVVARAWDYVVAQGYSTLDRERPGDPTALVQSARELAELLRARNPDVDVRLMATWSRADQTYVASGAWHRQPIERMALDVRAGNDLAAATSPAYRGVIPVGEAWNRAMRQGVADADPYDGLASGQVDLWTFDRYHASTFGSYLEALVVFGDLTGLDPRSLGGEERAAFDLGLSGEQAVALQNVAYEELAARPDRPAPRAFERVAQPAR